MHHDSRINSHKNSFSFAYYNNKILQNQNKNENMRIEEKSHNREFLDDHRKLTHKNNNYITIIYNKRLL